MLLHFATRAEIVLMRNSKEKNYPALKMPTNGKATHHDVIRNDLLHGKNNEIKLPKEIWTWSRGMKKHVTIHVLLLSH